MNYQNIKIIILVALANIMLSSCSSDVGGNEDKIAPSTIVDAIVDADDIDTDIVGTATIQWTTDETNRSTVDIFLSSDSGETFDTEIVLNIADTGSYEWDTNSVTDCRACRLRIVATDVVGNVGEPADSADDFIINNVPEVLGVAYLFDSMTVSLPGQQGDVDCNDILVVPFDKDIDIRTPIGRDLQLKVSGDTFGSQASVTAGKNANEVNVKISNTDGCVSNVDGIHLHVAGNFDSSLTGIASSSGVDVVAGLPLGTISAKDTGLTARPSIGVDIAPTYYSSGTVGTDAATTVAVALGHLDDDAILDAVVINTNNAGINAVYKGLGGYFLGYASGSQPIGDGANTSVVLGDVNGDGDNDIVVGNSGGSFILLNDGLGLMTLDVTLTDTNTVAVILADVDNDDDLDIIFGANGGNQIWINQGGTQGGSTGSYLYSGQALGSSNTKDLALGDIDNDGDLDIVTANNGEANRVWRNNGSGTFSEDALPQVLGNAASQSIKLGDIDNDGDIDILTGNQSSGNGVWLNDGTGLFSDSGQSLGNGNTVVIAISDYDGDGDIDIISGNNNSVNIVWINDGQGIYKAAPWFLDSAISNNTVDIALGDFDTYPDGDIDIFEGIGAGIREVTWVNNARNSTPFIDSGISLGNSDSQSIKLGDIDADGDIDMVVGNFGEPDQVYFNNGIGVFTESSQLLDSVAGFNNTRSVALTDVNNDGFLDYIAGNDSQPNLIWINNGAGVFTDSNQTLGNSSTASIVLVDIDGINGPDLITGNLGEPNRVWRNNGSGVFSEDAMPQTLGNALTTSITAGDLDNDGDVDLVVGNVTEPNAIWLNSGVNSGTFVTGGTTSGIGTTRQVVLGDIDNDGDLDIVAANDSVGSLIRLNNGAGVFLDSGTVYIQGNGIEIFDYDSDGDLDIIFDTGFGGYFMSKNRGDGIFANIPGFGDTLGVDPVGSSDIATGDVDGDGDIDVVTAIDSGEASKIYLNDY